MLSYIIIIIIIMNLLNNKIIDSVKIKIIHNILSNNYTEAISGIIKTINKLYESIPDNKRISYGIVYTIKILSKFLYNSLIEKNTNILKIGTELFNNSIDFKSKMTALGILSYYGLDDFKNVLPYFEIAAKSEDWNEREISQMLFRKIIKKYPLEIQDFLFKLIKSDNIFARRFIAETLRPVCENNWLYKNPDYSLSILKHIFKEKNEYPRTSVGNNLSDLSKKLPELVYNIVKNLVASKDKNSYWIAYRACRNLVKKEPLKVLNLLKTEQYKYKKNIFKRNDYM